MNNPDNMPIDVEEQRSWLDQYKMRKGVSWSTIAAASDIPSATLTLFSTGKYLGNNENVARRIFKWRQLLDSQAARTEGLQVEPGYFETPSSRRVMTLLTIAHMGRITVGAMGPGTGKTKAAKEYAASVPHVWLATMKPTTKSLAAMISVVLRAIGGNAKTSWTRQMSYQVEDLVRGKRGLLMVDEAQHLEWDALEEIRAWHDETGLGVCLLGNEELMQRIQSGPRRDAFARLNSRIAQSHIQNLPVQEDVEALCDAYEIADEAMRGLLIKIAMTPGAGGLRECRQIIEQGSMLAVDENRPLSFGDLRDAQATRATRNIRVA